MRKSILPLGLHPNVGNEGETQVLIYVILSQGFEQSKVDRVQDGYLTYFLVVVDNVPDILVANNDLASVTALKVFCMTSSD